MTAMLSGMSILSSASLASNQINSETFHEKVQPILYKTV
jgi:hypothetical protein